MNRIIPFFVLLFVLVSCGPERHLKRGDQYQTIGEYYEASLEYAKAYAMTPAAKKDKRGVIAYKVADCNRLINYSAKALAAYRNAARYKYTDTLTWFYQAEMERYARDYKQAAKDYQLYLKDHPSDPAALIGLQSCAAAPAWHEAGSNYTVREDRLFNSRYADYCPMLEGDHIYFTSTRKEATGDDMNGITGMKSGDLFSAAKDEHGKWKKVEALPATVNTIYDEGACAFSPDGKTMYFTRCRWDRQYPRMAEIYTSSRSDASWGKPALCELSKDTLSSYAHPAVSPDGQWLYFVSDMPGGQGGLDIWRASLTSHGIGMIENVGAPVNTPGDEMFPTFRPNGELYYSSNGKIGMGGLDLYKAVLDTVTKKWQVDHLPSPMNSNGDDFGMTFDGLHNRGYFCSNRSNRRGWDKIYTFECPEVLQTVKGWVYEQDGYELPAALVYMIGDDGTNKKLSVKMDGSFEQVLRPNVNYLFLATCEGYMNVKQSIRVDSMTTSNDYTLQFPLPSMNIPVLVRNVFYDYNKATILPSSIPALNKLTELLKQNPSITIELSSHCDYRGSQAYNERLSQHRAESVVRYLIDHGISEKRVVAKGYGKLHPKVITKKFAEMYPFLHAGDTLTENFIKKKTRVQQDSCNALNRRTEFSVLRTTYGLLDEKGNIKPDALKQKQDTTTTKGKAAVPAKADAKAGANANAKTNAKANAKAKANVNAKTKTKAGASVNAKANVNANAKADSTAQKAVKSNAAVKKPTAPVPAKKDSVATIPASKAKPNVTPQKTNTATPAQTQKGVAKASPTKSDSASASQKQR